MKEIIFCATRELLRRRGRAIANIFGYFLAVGIMTVMVNLLLVSKYAESKILEGTGTHFMLFLPACGDVASLTPEEVAALASGVVPARCQDRCKECTGCHKKPIDLLNEAFMANTVTTRLLPMSLVQEVKKLPSIKDASPYLLFRFRDPTDGHLFTLGGFDPANNQAVGTTCCAKGDIVAGRFLNATETGDVCLVEQGYAMARGIEVGSSIPVAGRLLEVVGIVNPGVRPAKADVYTPFSTAESLINSRIKAPLFNEMNILLVEVASSTLQEEAIEGVKSLISSGIITTYACYQPAAQVMGMNAGAIWLISAVLGIAAIGFSMKSQLSSVIERRNDIGILKAIGWSDSIVLRQILTESIIQSTIGGMLGCFMGVIFLLFAPIKSLLAIQVPISVSVSPTVLFAGIILAILGGLIAGFVPAMSAAKQNPSDLLRKI